jgi:hypothetical protein
LSGPGAIEAHKRTIGVLQDLVADLVAYLLISEPQMASTEEVACSRGVSALRRRTANALPPDKLPTWLEPFRDPSVSGESL